MPSGVAPTGRKRKILRTSRIKPFNLRYGNRGVITTRVASPRPQGECHPRRVGSARLQLGVAVSFPHFSQHRSLPRFDGGIIKDLYPLFFPSIPKISEFCVLVFVFVFFFFTTNGRNQLCTAAGPWQRGRAAASIAHFGISQSKPPQAFGLLSVTLKNMQSPSALPTPTRKRGGR